MNICFSEDCGALHSRLLERVINVDDMIQVADVEEIRVVRQKRRNVVCDITSYQQSEICGQLTTTFRDCDH